MAFSEDPAHAIPAASMLRRSRRRWRIVAFLALLIAVLALAGRFALELESGGEAHIARIDISGAISTNRARTQVFADVGDDEAVKAVILTINSPGGTTAGGEELYEAISRLRAKKPVVAVINELGASAAYMTAIAADRIYARRLSIVGSIGVLFQHVNAGKLLDTIGIEFDKVQTGPLKAEPDINEPLAGAPRRSLQALVDDSFEWFVDIVAERRGMDRAVALELADGRIVTGRTALDEGLIDAIGGEDEAIAWLQGEHGVDADYSVLTHYPFPQNDLEQIFEFIGSSARSMFGFNPKSAIPLDGLVSLWQATATN